MVSLLTLFVAALASLFMAWAIGAGSSGSTPFAPAVGANAIGVMRAGFIVGLLGLAGASLQGANVTEAVGSELVAGGTLAGLAGAIEVAGIQDQLRPDFSPGYGFTAIPVALLGRRGALRVALAGLFFAVLVVGGSSMELAFAVPAAIVEVIQALVILFLITAEFFKRYRVSLERDRTTAPTAAGEA